MARFPGMVEPRELAAGAKSFVPCSYCHGFGSKIPALRLVIEALTSPLAGSLLNVETTTLLVLRTKKAPRGRTDGGSTLGK